MDGASYLYETLRAQMFTDEGQRVFLKVRDAVKETMRQTGAIRMQEAIRVGATAATSGDVGDWEMMACVDRMVELGELIEASPGRFTAGNRVFLVPR